MFRDKLHQKTPIKHQIYMIIIFFYYHCVDNKSKLNKFALTAKRKNVRKCFARLFKSIEIFTN